MLAAASPALVVAAAAVSPRSAASLASMVAGSVLGAVLLLASGLSGGSLPRRARPFALAAAAAVGWLSVCSTLAIDPGVSFWGLIGQHAGALTWIAALAWFIAFASGRRHEAMVTSSIAVAGSAAAAWALADAFGLVGGAQRFSAETSGFLESSSSLGHLLVLAIPCTAVWALTTSRTGGRAALFGLVAVQTAVLVISEARGSLVAAAFAGAAAWIATRSRPDSPMRSRGAIVFAISAAISAAFLALPRLAPPKAVETLLNQRWSIWRSASEAFLGAPLIGRGPDQFSSFLTWDAVAGGGISSQSAFDPHALPLYWAVSAGLPGMLLALTALAALTAALLRLVGGRGWRPALMFGALAGLVVSLQFAWVHPTSLFAAAALAGTLLADRTPQSHGSRGLLAFGAIATAVAVGSIVLFASDAALEWRWAAGRSPTGEETVAATDPGFAVLAARRSLDGATDPTSAREAADDALELLGSHKEAGEWHVELALAETEATLARGGETTWRDLSTALTRGKSADPSTSLWDYIGATQAASLGLSDESRRYAAEAKRRGLPASAAPEIERILSQGR